MNEYFTDYTRRKIPHRAGPLDDQGLPMFDPRPMRLPAGVCYHPLVIIQYALAHHTLLVRGRRDVEPLVLRCVDWLRTNAYDDGRFVAWRYPFALRTPPVAPLWISGMAQGQALSLLVRVWEFTGRDDLLELAARVAESFRYSLEDGGVVAPVGDGASFIEEVAARPALHILNGSLYGLVGLHEFLVVRPDSALSDIFQRCMVGVERLLPHFDTGYWSRYSLGVRWHCAPVYYHDVHIHQLMYVSSLTGSRVLEEYGHRWNAYRRSPWLRVRQKLTEVCQVNLNRVLTLSRFDQLKYRSVSA